MKRTTNIILTALAGLTFFTACDKNENEATGVISPIVGVQFVRDLYNGDDIELKPELLMGAHQVAGVVISDETAGNSGSGELVLQNISKGKLAGISLSFGENVQTGVALGDSVKISIAGGTLTRKNGKLQITGLNKEGITKVSSGKSPLIRVVSVSELYSNFHNYENTLVRINNAGITPIPVNGESFAGDKRIDDGTGGVVYLSTETDAAFAGNSLPLNASFTGIATYYNATKNTNVGARQLLKLRNEDDMTNASGATYANFPEDFEFAPASQKSTYDMPAIDNNVTFKSGSWKLYQAMIGTDRVNDKLNPTGAQAIRMQKDLSVSALLQMNFDLPHGASKVTVAYGFYGASGPSSTWKLEYSQDGGASWQQIGQDVTDAGAKATSITFNMDIKGPVRFRINKLGLGVSNVPFLLNGILNIDDFAVYQNVD